MLGGRTPPPYLSHTLNFEPRPPVLGRQIFPTPPHPLADVIFGWSLMQEVRKILDGKLKLPAYIAFACCHVSPQMYSPCRRTCSVQRPQKKQILRAVESNDAFQMCRRKKKCTNQKSACIGIVEHSPLHAILQKRIPNRQINESMERKEKQPQRGESCL